MIGDLFSTGSASQGCARAAPPVATIRSPSGAYAPASCAFNAEGVAENSPRL